MRDVVAGEVAALYHRETSQGTGRWPQPAVAGFVPMDPRNRPRPFKRYPQARIRYLPRELPLRGVAAADVLSGRVPPGGGTVDAEQVARLLFYSAGVVRVAADMGEDVSFRAAASAGNLHPVEVYVVVGNVPGIPAGLYHFAPDAFGLEELLAGDCREAIGQTLAEPDLAASPVVLVLTGIPWRTAWKYAERGWRHVYWDAGTMLANLLAVAEGDRLPARVWFGFVDSALCRLLGIDGRAEFPVAVITVGVGEEAASASSGPLAGTMPEPAPVSRRQVEFPSIAGLQEAGNLVSADRVKAWRTAAVTGASHASPAVGAPAACSSDPIETVVLRRGSTRRMRRATASVDLLRWGLAVAGRPVPTDAIAEGSSLLLSEVAVHAVRDVPSGLYHWVEGAAQPYRLMPEGQVRDLSRRLCLDQSLGGDSAYTVYACADLERILNRCGDRGYRVAQLEAGVVAGRLQLAASTLDCGGTGLTFLDEDVSTAFDTSAACMLAISIGVPAYRAKPGGSPGRPTRLAL
jgi:SagB-type dehydrogenase family enzyme